MTPNNNNKNKNKRRPQNSPRNSHYSSRKHVGKKSGGREGGGKEKNTFDVDAKCRVIFAAASTASVLAGRLILVAGWEHDAHGHKREYFNHPKSDWTLRCGHQHPANPEHTHTHIHTHTQEWSDLKMESQSRKTLKNKSNTAKNTKQPTQDKKHKKQITITTKIITVISNHITIAPNNTRTKVPRIIHLQHLFFTPFSPVIHYHGLGISGQVLAR